MDGAPASAPEAPLIRLARVSKEYDTGGAVVRAMREVSLSIGPGELVAIVGASGSGKSTLMNVLGCLDRPTEGTYTLAGIDVGRRAGDSRAIVRNQVIGFVFQGFNLLPRTTARENVELPLQYRGVRLRERRRRAEAALQAVGLGDRMTHTPNQLSGGQQQRVAIARAIVTDPPLLLADEPTGNLDTRTSLEVLALLQRLNRQRGITVVLVTHERDIAARASRVISMRDGRVISDVSQRAPADAQAALRELGPADGADSSSQDKALSPAPVGGRLPPAIYGMMLAGQACGLGVGAAYAGGVLRLGATGLFWTAAAAGELGLGWIGGKGARRILRRTTTRDERARMAWWYTVIVTFGAAGAAGSAWFWTRAAPAWMAAPLDGEARQMSMGALAAVAAAILIALALMRYLLLTLFAPRH